MKKLVPILVFIFVLINPCSAQTKQEKITAKKEVNQQQYNSLKQLINSETYYFEADWLTSNTGLRVNLISNPNFLKMDQQLADAYLPFFGVVYSANYGGGGIEFKGDVKNYRVTFNDKKLKSTIHFSAKNKTENYDVTLTVFSNGNASVTVNSNYRSSIYYDGKLTTLKKEN